MKSKYGLSFDRNLKEEEKWKSDLQSTSEDQKFWWAARGKSTGCGHSEIRDSS
ncbi:MAG: hypothetical protein SPH71_06310 [Eubacteriales bacterium]|nr:hypothetical protein [Eubacteriales bacterium]